MTQTYGINLLLFCIYCLILEISCSQHSTFRQKTSLCSFPVTNVRIKLEQEKCWKHIIAHYTRTWNTSVTYVAIKHQLKEPSKGTNSRSMKGKSIHAGNVTTRLHQRVISLDTRKPSMGERSTHVICAAIKQLGMTSSRHTWIKCIRPKQYNYSRSLILNILNIVFIMNYKLHFVLLWCCISVLSSPVHLIQY